jgi:CheY-like chemotaxis protein
MMHGDAGAESIPGKGSRFWFTARLRTPKGTDQAMQTLGAPSDADAEQIIRQRHAGCRILVVDDEPVNREVAKMLLEDTGVTVDTANDGAQALAMASGVSYAAIFMDMQMPKLDGLAATLRIRRLPGYAMVPIIAMTANAFAEDRARCMEAGMNDFLAKPFDPDKLFAILLTWLSKAPD